MTHQFTTDIDALVWAHRKSVQRRRLQEALEAYNGGVGDPARNLWARWASFTHNFDDDEDFIVDRWRPSLLRENIVREWAMEPWWTPWEADDWGPRHPLAVKAEAAGWWQNEGIWIALAQFGGPDATIAFSAPVGRLAFEIIGPRRGRARLVQHDNEPAIFNELQVWHDSNEELRVDNVNAAAARRLLGL